MLKIIDEMSELIYIADMDNYDLHYLNCSGKKNFDVGDDLTGKKCYEVLQGQTHPCDFCTNSILSEDRFHTWEKFNPVTKRHYLLKDRIIVWEGKKARLEIAFDITAKEAQQAALQNNLKVEKMVSLCAKELNNFERDNSALERTLKYIGEFLLADRTYLFKNDDTFTHNTHEWCSSDTTPEICNLQNVPLSAIQRWLMFFSEGKPVIIHDLEEIKDISPEEYQILSKQKIHSLIACPLLQNGTCIGYIGADNFSTPLLTNTILLLTSISHFVSSALYRQQTMKQLEHMGYYDELTGLMNRNAYLRDLKKKVHKPMGVIYIDVNGIKKINDRLGHGKGDEVLADISKTIREQTPDANAYRVGGDEFVLLLKNIQEEDFSKKSLLLKTVFSQKGNYAVAIGSCWSHNPQNIKKLIMDSDKDMYSDKRSYYRKNTLTDRYRHHLDDILQLTQPGILPDMIRAGNFELFFQPRFSIQENVMVGAEALVRCRTDDGLVYAPNQFIPILENAGLIQCLDFYVFEQVCITLAKWNSQGMHPGIISSNFSRRTINTPDFIDRLNEIRNTYNISLEQLELEITEAMDLENQIALIKATNLLNHSHFRITIDNFGVRHADLLLLTDVDFDVLKISKNMVDNIMSNKKTQLLLPSLIDACQKLNVHVVAVGIENQDQLDILRQIGCKEGQGYCLSHPLSKPSFEQLLCREIKQPGTV